MKKETERPGKSKTQSPDQAKPARERQSRLSDSPFGLGRTLSTEFMAQEAALRALEYINGLFEIRTWKPGEVITQKGNVDRDLFFIAKGVVDILSEEDSEEIILNSIEAPYIVGDVGFLSGLPRTATAKAKTEVKTFILKYRNFENIFKGSPQWLSPVINSLVSGLKSLHYRVEELQERGQESESNEGA